MTRLPLEKRNEIFLSTHLTRRAFHSVAATTVAASFVGFASEAAADAASDADLFLTLSMTLTGFSDLDPKTASRLAALLSKDNSSFSASLQNLNSALQAQGANEPDLNKITDTASKTLAEHILFAWYTGSAADEQNAASVAYRDALMYRTVADGLPAPTYCLNGPAWWTATPPMTFSLPQ